jgi:hypothetical protein
MTAVDQFFKSVRDVFAKNRDVHWTQIALALGAVVVVVIALSMWFGRWRSRRRMAARLDAVATAAGLTGADREYLNRIAGAAGLPVLEVMTSLAPFEHATAVALASDAPPLRPVATSAFERVRLLRKALGFAPLSPHLWLLSTRELVEGDPISLGGATGHVVAVNEASFAVDLPEAAVPALGASSRLAIDRADDARYLARVRLLAVEAPPGLPEGGQAGIAVHRAFFAHDEQPDRQQHREHVRVRAHGVVTMVDPGKGPTATMTGALVDVSAGGLALELPVLPDGAVRRGARLRCSFTLGENDTFEDMETLVVAAAAGPRTGMQHLRLSFTGLPESARDRLVAAVARHELRASARGDR